MQRIRQAIKEIIAFKKAFDKIDPRIPKKLVGELGEFYVLLQLQKLGFRPEHKGGKGGYDIRLEDTGKRIEVRTSLWKNEGVYRDQTIKFWGWRVENRNQRRHGQFDYLVGVGLRADFSGPRFYLFTYKEAFSVGDTMIGQFANIKKKIHLFKSRRAFLKAIRDKRHLVTRYERYINRHRAEFLNKWGKMK